MRALSVGRCQVSCNQPCRPSFPCRTAVRHHSGAAAAACSTSAAPDEGTQSSDATYCAIIGAGLAGVATAWHVLVSGRWHIYLSMERKRARSPRSWGGGQWFRRLLVPSASGMHPACVWPRVRPPRPLLPQYIRTYNYSNKGNKAGGGGYTKPRSRYVVASHMHVFWGPSFHMRRATATSWQLSGHPRPQRRCLPHRTRMPRSTISGRRLQGEPCTCTCTMQQALLQAARVRPLVCCTPTPPGARWGLLVWGWGRGGGGGRLACWLHPVLLWCVYVRACACCLRMCVA